MKKVTDFIQKEQLIQANDKVLLGFSGGADSVVLLHLLASLGYACEAAHVNFQLRGNESDEDALFCRNFCKRYEIPFHYLEVNTKAYATKHRISVEMAAREIRYTWFNKLLDEHHLNVIAVAHHKNDQAETILLNLIRGTGVAGLKGMLPKNGNVIRPLLCMTRQEIEEYIQNHNLKFRTDNTNADTTFRRNLIRHRIMPEIESINPAFTDTVDALAQRFKESAAIVDVYVHDWIDKHMKDPRRIPVNALFQNAASMTILHRLLSEFGFSASLIMEVYRAYPFRSGARFYGALFYVLADRDYLLLEPIKQQEQKSVARVVYPDNKLGSNLHFEELSRQDIESIPGDASVACLDLDKLKLPLMLRNWQHGDKFRPLGMKGLKKISDFLIDEKVNMVDKASVKVLISDDEIVWVLGYRIDDHYKIDKNTKYVLKIEILEA